MHNALLSTMHSFLIVNIIEFLTFLCYHIRVQKIGGADNMAKKQNKNGLTVRELTINDAYAY